MKRRVAIAFIAVILAGCPQPRPTPPDAPGPQPSTPQRPGPTTAPPPGVPSTPPSQSSATNLDGYKRDFARRVIATSSHLTFTGKLPEVLHAVVVMQITVNTAGQATRVTVMRTPDYARELGQVAADTVRRATPLPIPARALMRGSELQFTETWLFRANGTFQMRALADPQ